MSQLRPRDFEAEKQKADVITAYVEKFGAITGKVVTPQMYAIYVEALGDLEIKRIEKGLKRYLQEGTNWPWPGMLGSTSRRKYENQSETSKARPKAG